MNYDYNIGKRILGIKLSSSSDVFGNDIWVYAESLINNDSMLERVEYAMQESKYNGHFTVYLYKKDTLLGSSRIILSNIEGVPSEEQIEADKAVAEAERKAQEEAEKQARAKKETELNAKGKVLANGYKYHGIEELEKNRKLFLNGALESGHAYYISGFVVKNSGSMAQIEYGDIFFLSSQSNPVYIDYINQKVKAEVIDAGIVTFMGQTAETPLTVVVAGGKGFSNTPVVLGIVESSVNDRLNEAIEEINSNL